MNLGTATIASERRVKLPGANGNATSFGGALPWPPTVNTYWRNITVNGKSRVLVSAKGRAYRDAVARAVGRVQPLAGPLVFSAVYYPPDNRKRDLDNLFKSLLDALTAAGVWANDSQVREIHARFGDEVRPGGEVDVAVAPVSTDRRVIPVTMLDALVNRIGVMSEILGQFAERGKL